MSAIAAVDTALWDIKGKIAGLPLYQLLGSACREACMVYGHANGTTPLAVGEIFNAIWDAGQLIEERLIDFIRATLVHAGGITHLRRVASFADLHGVCAGCHAATDLLPVCMAAALHFGLSIPNFGIHEYMRHTPETDAVFPHAYSFANGTMHQGEQPGLDVAISEELAAQYEYRRAYLPVNRLEDGTMFNW